MIAVRVVIIIMEMQRDRLGHVRFGDNAFEVSGGDLNTVWSLFAVLLGLRLKPVLFGQSNNRGNSERALLCWLSLTSIEKGLSAKVHSGSSSVIPREWSRFEICIEIVCFLVSIIKSKHRKLDILNSKGFRFNYT